MLLELHIQDFLITQNITMNFSRGFNVITGETGSGKSLLIDALSILLGDKFEESHIRKDTNCSTISAIFEKPKHSPDLEKILLENGLEEVCADSNEIIFRRVCSRGQKVKNFISDIPVSTKVLIAVVQTLIDVSSQFANQRILKPAMHTKFLDLNLDLEKNYSEYERFFSRINSSFQKLNQLKLEKDKVELQKDFTLKSLEEIEAAAPNQQEFEELEQLVKKGLHRIEIQRLISETESLLSSETNSVMPLLARAKKNVEKIAKVIENTDVTIFDEARASIELSIHQLHKLFLSLEINEEILNMAQNKLDVIHRLLRKYGPTFEDLLDTKAKASQLLQSAHQLDKDIQKLEKEIIQESIETLSKAENLSSERKKGAPVLSQKITTDLKALGLEKATFICSLEQKLSTWPSNLIEFLTPFVSSEQSESLTFLTREGLEGCRFKFSANPGYDPAPIENVASGGELSRMMLAIKSCLSETFEANVFVFDEIDTGISGKVAAKVGKKLKKFCEDKQAIVITHLPQVACEADKHFVVEKLFEKKQTITRVKEVDKEDRVKAIAALFSGENISSAALKQAKQLLEDQ